MKSYLLLCVGCFLGMVCIGQNGVNQGKWIRPQGSTIEARIALPQGYTRIEVEKESFGGYLRTLPLRPQGAKVHYFDGAEKWNRKAYCAVVDLEIGKRDLQQCVDAVIRLRAEFLYQRKAYDKIHFKFTNGFRAGYIKWAEGYRVSVKGNQVTWYKAKEKDYSYATFRAYLDIVFAYAGTLSLSKELKSVPMTSMQIGDVLIQGGAPGHAVIVVDMAIHQTTGQKLYLLAQSYMPAQDIQVLTNLSDTKLSPWYELKSGGNIITPEWVFTSKDLKRFVE